jgi:hypothetical protein
MTEGKKKRVIDKQPMAVKKGSVEKKHFTCSLKKGSIVH